MVIRILGVQTLSVMVISVLAQAQHTANPEAFAEEQTSESYNPALLEKAQGSFSEDAKKLGLLAVAQEENRAKISSFSLTMTEHLSFSARNDAGELEQYERVTTHREHTRGNSSWIDRQNRTVITGPNGTREDPFDERLIITDTSLAFWPVGNPVAYLYEFDSKNSWSREARAIAQTSNPRSVLRYGFADRELTLRQMHDSLLPDGFSVKVTEERDSSGGIQAYHLTILEGEARSPVEELTVDPNRGYLITHVKYLDDGEAYTEIKVQPEEVVPGIWFPMVWEEWQHHAADDGGREHRPFKYSMNKVTSIALGSEFDEDQFRWTSLNLPDGIEIIRKDSAARKSIMTSKNDELVPIGISEKLESVEVTTEK